MPITGSCHCGRVAFEVAKAPTVAYRCNCSYCSRRGWVHAYAATEDFRLLRGGATLKPYRFGAHTTTH